MDTTQIAATPSFPSPNMSKPDSTLIPVPIVIEWPLELHDPLYKALLHLPDSPSRLAIFQWKEMCYTNLKRSEVSHLRAQSVYCLYYA